MAIKKPLTLILFALITFAQISCGGEDDVCASCITTVSLGTDSASTDKTVCGSSSDIERFESDNSFSKEIGEEGYTSLERTETVCTEEN